MLGHSLWFKAFFQTYLPHDFEHDAKNKKVVNSGVIALTLLQAMDDDKHLVFAIDPDSIVSIYGGFEFKNQTLIG